MMKEKKSINAASQYTTFKVKEDKGLLEFIMEKLDGISRNKAKAILSGNGVLVDKRVESHFDFKLKPSMTVDISKHRNNKANEKNSYYHIVYEDRWLIVIDKEPNVLSMPVGKKGTNIKALLDTYFEESAQSCTAHIVHRLDKGTSGLMIYAKSIDVQQELENNWKEFVTDRRYIAVVEGQMEEKDGHIESWLQDDRLYVTHSSPVDNGGKYAITDYRTLDTGKNYSLVEFQLQTGRKNQIRVHAQDMNHPIVGDYKYGSRENPIGRMALHAYRLYFYHPITHKQLNFETPFPDKFLRLIKK
jgi:23S rRNA pseudouridine1911/1915/1917 synthase